VTEWPERDSPFLSEAVRRAKVENSEKVSALKRFAAFSTF
jgi:hypothetical protein